MRNIEKIVKLLFYPILLEIKLIGLSSDMAP